MLTMVYGGSACGKSLFGESLVTACPGSRVYIATMRVYDDEGRRKVERHRALRRAKGFSTIEAPRGLSRAAKDVPAGAAVLLECMGNLVSNELFDDEGREAPVEAVQDRILEGLDALCAAAADVVVVTNDIGADGCSYAPSTGRYIACLSMLNRILAQRADRVYEVVCGIPVPRKGGAF